MDKPERRLGPKPLAIVIGALAPYTHVLYQHLARQLDRPLHVLACSPRETSRQWVIDEDRDYHFEVLPGLRWHRSTVINHYFNPNVIRRLMALDPAAVIVNDFAPTMLMAAGVARLRGIPYGIRTDGVPEIDPGRSSRPHRAVRRALVPGASFGIGPSQGSQTLLRGYGLTSPFALSPLFPAWRPAGEPSGEDRPFDLMFCGTLNEEMKGARFFTDVVLGCLERGRRLRVRVVGDGPLRREMEDRFAQAGIPARFDGFLQQNELAEAYASATLFHFPSRGDVWGIVAQEALQSGTLVMASSHSGAARELVEPERCGLVLPLDHDAWVTHTCRLLDEPERQATLRHNGRVALQAFTPERAAAAYLAVLQPCLDARPAPLPRASHKAAGSKA